jgi:glyoxylase-like metal-dependent hydrolase (beta-lactamase superfamily II)
MMSLNSSVQRRVVLVVALGVLMTVAALVGPSSSPARAQAPGVAGRPPGANYTGSAFTITKIADGVYQAIATANMIAGCNAAIIVNDSDVLVVDSHMTPAAAWALREELKTITDKPIRYVVNTHWHFDHAHGNQIYGAGVEIIGTEFTRAQLASGASMKGRTYTSFTGAVPGQLEQVKKRLASATAAERPALESQLAALERHTAALASVKPVPPTITVDDTMVIHRGGREIRLLHLGRGHTGGDLVVFLPRERVVVTGDLMTNGTAYPGDSYPMDWIATLDRVKALQFDVVIPGHGEAFRDKAKIEHFQAYLKDFWSQAQRYYTMKVPAEQAAMQIDLRSHAKNFPAITAVGANVNGVLRMYDLLSGAEK